MKFAVEMGSGGMLYVPSFIRVGPGIQMLVGGFTDTQQGEILRLPFQNFSK
jgi:hypothetical protein